MVLTLKQVGGWAEGQLRAVIAVMVEGLVGSERMRGVGNCLGLFSVSGAVFRFDEMGGMRYRAVL